MGVKPIYRIATALLIAFFLSLQISSAMHVVHEDEEHNRQDCVACHIVSEEADFQAVISSETDFKLKFELTSKEDCLTFIETKARRNIQSRAPPPRGPPVTRS